MWGVGRQSRAIAAKIWHLDLSSNSYTLPCGRRCSGQSIDPAFNCAVRSGVGIFRRGVSRYTGSAIVTGFILGKQVPCMTRTGWRGTGQSGAGTSIPRYRSIETKDLIHSPRKSGTVRASGQGYRQRLSRIPGILL